MQAISPDDEAPEHSPEGQALTMVDTSVPSNPGTWSTYMVSRE